MSVASIDGVSIATPSVSNRVCRVVYDELAGRGDLFRGLDEGLAQSVGVVINVTEGHLVSTLTRLRSINCQERTLSGQFANITGVLWRTRLNCR